MDFTREPIIETIITPKEGYKLVIRSSKSASQEEYFVDAVEIVAFGHALFFRSLERPKAFLVPVSDYEALEVKEARMVLKNVGLDRSIKIGGGKEANIKASREEEKIEIVTQEAGEQEDVSATVGGEEDSRSDVRVDKKRDRRRNYRKRRGRDEGAKEIVETATPSLEDGKAADDLSKEIAGTSLEGVTIAPTVLSSLLQPPPTLISETINRYRQNDLFKGAFYLTEEEQYKPHDKVEELLNEEDEDEEAPILEEPTFDSTESLDGMDLVESKILDDSAESISPLDVIEEASEEHSIHEAEEGERPQMSLPIFAQEEDASVERISSHKSPHVEDKELESEHSPVDLEKEDESDKI